MVVNRKKRYRLSKQNVNNLMDQSVEIALFIGLRNEQKKKVAQKG